MPGIKHFLISNRALGGGIVLAFLVLGGGCQTGDDAKKEKPDKEASTLRLHMEENDIGLGVGKIEVIRANPIKLMVQKTAFLDEGDIAKAMVVEPKYGGHQIRIEYTARGKMALQMATAPRPGRHVAVWSKWTEGRWLAAPLVQRGIEDGIFVFTPDCSREEANRIVRGLNNVAIKLKNQPKPPKQKTGGKEKAVKPTEEQEMFK